MLLLFFITVYAHSTVHAAQGEPACTVAPKDLQVENNNSDLLITVIIQELGIGQVLSLAIFTTVTFFCFISVFSLCLGLRIVC